MASITHGTADVGGQGGVLSEAMRRGTAPGLLILFLITVLMPIRFDIGGTSLSPIRIYLLIAIIPCAIQILSGKVGRVTLVDWLFLAYGLWLFLALVVTTGGARIPFAGITAVEMCGGYFVGRWLIRSEADYRRVFRFMTIALFCLLPFTIYESVTGKMLLPDLLRPIFNTPYRGGSAYGRMGLERVYSVFEHPILWGLFCSMLFGNAIMLAGRNPFKMLPGAGIAGYGTFVSLSSAPLLSLMLQVFLLVAGWISGGRWRLLIILSIVGYVGVDLLSNRTPARILIDTLTFNPGTGYTRLAANEAAWRAVEASPLFGVGFGTWDRPEWVTDSIDNFWLVTAIRSGMVGAGLLIAAFLLHLWLMMRAKILDPSSRVLRVGHGVVLVGVAFTLITVHIWGGMSVFVMFYVGAGAWLYTFDHSSTGQTESIAAPTARRGVQYSRFVPSHSRDAMTEPGPGGLRDAASSINPVWRRDLR